MHCVATGRCEPAWPRDPRSLVLGSGAAVTLVAGRSRGNFVDSVKRANIYAEHARTSDASGGATPHHRKVRIGSDDSGAPSCANQVLQAFPRRLRSSSLATRRTALFVQNDVAGPSYRPDPRRRIPPHRKLPAALATIRNTATRFCAQAGSQAFPIRFRRVRPAPRRTANNCTRGNVGHLSLINVPGGADSLFPN